MRLRSSRTRSPARPLAVLTLVTATFVLPGCGSEYTVLSRNEVTVSPQTATSVQTLVPVVSRNPIVADHLAIATELYEKELGLLKERRNKVRARRRVLLGLALGTFATTTAGVAATSAAVGEVDASSGLMTAGIVSVAGLALGSTLAGAAIAQEDPEAIDAKIGFLERDYQTMLERLRGLDITAAGTTDEMLRARAGTIIEEFITHALAINVKG